MGGGSGDRKQLGKVALRQRLVTREEGTPPSPPTRGRAAVAEGRRAADLQLLEALSEQYGLPAIDLAQIVLPMSNLQLVPGEIARQHSILPILVKDDRVHLAMAEPGDRRVIDEIEFVTGLEVHPYVAIPDALSKVIDEAYRMLEQGEELLVGPEVPAGYLEELGIDRDEPIGSLTAPTPGEAAPGPPPVPAGAPATAPSLPPAPSARPPATEDHADDLGIEELVARRRSSEGPRASSGPSAHPGPARAAAKVLVVDDEDDIRRLLRRVLEERGYEVIESGKGLEALQLVRDRTPNLIVLDAMLPEVHGFDICRRIKGSQRYGDIPIVMISALYRGWRFAEDLKASYGVEAFLEKPFKIGDVLDAVERGLEGRPEPSVEDEALSREAEALLAESMAAYQGGDVDGAIERLHEGLGIDPLSFKLHYHLGLLLGRRDDVFEAIHELEAAVDLQPRHFSALKNLAVLYQRAGFKHKAIESWERALANAPDEETRQGIKDHLMTLL